MKIVSSNQRELITHCLLEAKFCLVVFGDEGSMLAILVGILLVSRALVRRTCALRGRVKTLQTRPAAKPRDTLCLGVPTAVAREHFLSALHKTRRHLSQHHRPCCYVTTSLGGSLGELRWCSPNLQSLPASFAGCREERLYAVGNVKPGLLLCVYITLALY